MLYYVDLNISFGLFIYKLKTKIPELIEVIMLMVIGGAGWI
jgi:hypothetical protein